MTKSCNTGYTFPTAAMPPPACAGTVSNKPLEKRKTLDDVANGVPRMHVGVRHPLRESTPACARQFRIVSISTLVFEVSPLTNTNARTGDDVQSSIDEEIAFGNPQSIITSLAKGPSPCTVIGLP